MGKRTITDIASLNPKALEELACIEKKDRAQFAERETSVETTGFDEISDVSPDSYLLWGLFAFCALQLAQRALQVLYCKSGRATAGTD